MKSLKKSMLVMAAVFAAMAVVLPSVASAARLETESGALVPKGATFSLTGHEVHVGAFIGGGTSAETCQTVVLRGQVTENSGTSVKAVTNGAGSVECHGSAWPYVQITAGELVGLSIVQNGSGGDTATLSPRFVQTMTNKYGESHNCEIHGTMGISYVRGTSQLKAANSFGLEACTDLAGLVGTFTMTDASGNPIVLN